MMNGTASPPQSGDERSKPPARTIVFEHELRTLRRTTRILTAVSVMSCGIAVAAFARNSHVKLLADAHAAPSVEELVQAKRLRIVDDKGIVRMELGFEKGFTYLDLHGPRASNTEEAAAHLRMSADGSGAHSGSVNVQGWAPEAGFSAYASGRGTTNLEVTSGFSAQSDDHWWVRLSGGKEAYTGIFNPYPWKVEERPGVITSP